MKISKKAILTVSFPYFAKEIYGLKMLDAHLKMADHIENAGNRSLLLCMRGIGKSAVLKAYITWHILNNQNSRVVLVSSTDSKARMFMRAIKQTLESQIIKDIWGDVIGSVWQDREIILKGRTEIYSEATLTCLGAGSGSITGGHFSLAIIDDACDFDSTRSELQRNRLRDWYLTSFLPTILADGEVKAAGTRYHPADLWNTLSEHLDYNTLILPPVNADGTAQCAFLRPIDDVKDEAGNVITVGLKTTKRELGSVIYALQYENDVELLKEGNIINHNWIKTYKHCPPLDKVIIACDPAISKKDSADYTAIIVGGKIKNGDIYIKDYINARMSFNETIEKLKSLATIYSPVEIRIERVGFSEAFITELKRELPGTVINGVVPRGDKESRLRAVSPMFENGLVYFHTSHGVVIDQLLLFPDSDHDDLVDAVQIFMSYYKNTEPGIIIW